MRVTIDKIKRFMANFASKFESLSNDKSTGTKSEEKMTFQYKYRILPDDRAIFPTKIVEVADGYIAVFDHKIMTERAEVWVLHTHDGRYAAFLIFDGLYWIPLEELDFERFNDGFRLYLAGSSKRFWTTKIEYQLDIKNERYLQLYTIRLSVRKANEGRGGTPKERIFFVRNHVPEEVRFSVH